MDSNVTSPSSKIQSCRNHKPSNKLKVECLMMWLKDHKAFKPKPSFLPADSVNALVNKFKK